MTAPAPRCKPSTASLTAAQIWLLQKALANHPDGGRILGRAKHQTAKRLQDRGLLKLLVGGNGLISRVVITDAGRAAIQSEKTP